MNVTPVTRKMSWSNLMKYLFHPENSDVSHAASEHSVADYDEGDEFIAKSGAFSIVSDLIKLSGTMTVKFVLQKNVNIGILTPKMLQPQYHEFGTQTWTCGHYHSGSGVAEYLISYHLLILVFLPTAKSDCHSTMDHFLFVVYINLYGKTFNFSFRNLNPKVLQSQYNEFRTEASTCGHHRSGPGVAEYLISYHLLILVFLPTAKSDCHSTTDHFLFVVYINLYGKTFNFSFKNLNPKVLQSQYNEFRTEASTCGHHRSGPGVAEYLISYHLLILVFLPTAKSDCHSTMDHFLFVVYINLYVFLPTAKSDCHSTIDHFLFVVYINLYGKTFNFSFRNLNPKVLQSQYNEFCTEASTCGHHRSGPGVAEYLISYHLLILVFLPTAKSDCHSTMDHFLFVVYINLYGKTFNFSFRTLNPKVLQSQYNEFCTEASTCGHHRSGPGVAEYLISYHLLILVFLPTAKSDCHSTMDHFLFVVYINLYGKTFNFSFRNLNPKVLQSQYNEFGTEASTCGHHRSGPGVAEYLISYHLLISVFLPTVKS
ncbi:hypothetical protein FQA39_LY04137 [Lamprigera yunnana]|nr:hypothetical protein FQA39_LY04137 [Lamprigera yunnana]